MEQDSIKQNENHRTHFRLTYPQPVRPRLIMDHDQYEIENVSESGVKVITGSDKDFMVRF